MKTKINWDAELGQAAFSLTEAQHKPIFGDFFNLQ